MNKQMSDEKLQINTLKEQLQLMHSYLCRVHEIVMLDKQGVCYSSEITINNYKTLGDSIMSQNGMEVD